MAVAHLAGGEGGQATPVREAQHLQSKELVQMWRG